MDSAKQLKDLSKVYMEAVYGGEKKKSTDMIVTNADKKANTKAYQNLKAGVKGYKAADHMNEAVKGQDTEMRKLAAADRKAGKDKKLPPSAGKNYADFAKYKIKKAKEYADTRESVVIEKKKEPRWQDDDGDGKWYEKSDVDGKISKREKKAKKHDCASKVKHEEFGVGNCIKGMHDLDESGKVAHYDVWFGHGIEKNVPVSSLEILEGHMHEHVIREGKGKKNCGCGQDPCITYGKDKNAHKMPDGTVMPGKTHVEAYVTELKKTTLGSYVSKASKDLSDRRFDQGRSEKATYEPDADDDKEEMKLRQREKGISRAAKKLSKEESEYIEVAQQVNKAKHEEDLNRWKSLEESGKFSKEEMEGMMWNEFDEGYQRDPEGGEEKERKAKRERKGGYDEKRERRMNDPKTGINSDAFKEFMRSRGM